MASSVVRIPSAALLVFALATSSPAFGRATIGAVQPVPSIYNFGQVSATYYRGAEPEAADFAMIAKLGLKTVIDLQKDGNGEEAAGVERAGMQYLQIPMTTLVAPTPAQIAHFLAVVGDPANQPVRCAN